MNEASGAPDGAFLLVAILSCALSGVPGMVWRRRGSGERIAAVLVAGGAVLGLVVAVRVLLGLAEVRVRLPSPLPGGPLLLWADPLSAAFLLPLFLVAGLGAIYGLGYWPERDHPESGRRLRLSWGLLTAAMATVTLARSGILFLVAWEVMALAAYFAATADDREAPVREAGWVYLVATHTGTVFLLAMVALLRERTGTFLWEGPLPGGGDLDSVIFALALVGFGFKAGMVPLHFWLPGAHANAPSHVSALMSGVMLKMGIYGILRVGSLFAEPAPWWGTALLVLGTVTAVLGVVLANTQGDLKRLLAYSSVENVGIILMGMGLAFVGRASGRADWALLGLAATALHVWNHGLFKPLLFLSAGAVIHAAHTRSMDAMGGLLRPLPRTGASFAVGALAVAGLPPLNGFVGELCLYVGLFSVWNAGAEASLLAGLAIPALALVGAVALACFVRAFGAVFLGVSRSPAAAPPHEAGRAMWLPTAVLAAACIAAGLLAPLLAPAVDGLGAWWLGRAGTEGPVLLALVPLGWVTLVGVGLLGAVLLLGLALRRLTARAPAAVTWDCGYTRPSPRMAYTARSLGEWLGERVPPRWLAPFREEERPRGLFPTEGKAATRTPDPFLRRLFEPLLAAAAARSARLRFLQQGRLLVYLTYILVTVLLLLGWAALQAMVPA